MSRRVLVGFACNNPDNGLFCGRALLSDAFGLELHHDDWERGCAFTVDDARLRFRIGRVWYPYVQRKEWYGNWCWDAFWMKRPQAVRLLKALRDSGNWACEGGPTRLCEWWDKRGRAT